MLKATGTFKTQTNSSIYISGTHYLFFKPYLSTPGSLLVEVVVFKNTELTEEVWRFYLPVLSSQQVTGGNGATEYDKLIDVIENIAINHIQADNPEVVLEKISFDNQN